jgi:predicted kinase
MSDLPDDLLILTGPPGSGKTTGARLLTSSRDRAVHLESDLFWHFIASGYIEPWKTESHEQNKIVMQTIADVATRYARAGYFTVIDGIVSPRWFFEPIAHRAHDGRIADRMRHLAASSGNRDRASDDPSFHSAG